MKRHGNLFKKVTSISNIKEAIKIAAKNKHSRPDVQNVIMNIDAYASEIRKMLINGEFHTSEYKIHAIYEPKRRDIYVLPFYPDRIVHHCIMNILEPIFDSWFINDSYCCRAGKGSIAASDKCSKYVNNFKFCVQYDIKHYFPSINHDILMNIIERKIKDNKLLDLLSDIIYSIDGPTNLPIGNHTSQWFGNLYLNELDQFVMHNLDKRFHNYIRYCDDFLFFVNTKEDARYLHEVIPKFLHEKLQLSLSKAITQRTKQGVKFVGFRHFKKGKILLRKSTVKKQKKRLKSVKYELRHGAITIEQARSVVASIYGWMIHANTYNLRKSLKLDKLCDAFMELTLILIEYERNKNERIRKHE